MTVQSAPMFWAQCDYLGCEVTTKDFDKGNHVVYDKPEDLMADLDRTWEGGLDDWGWLRVGERHYCGDHTQWSDETDKRVPVPESHVSGREEER